MGTDDPWSAVGETVAQLVHNQQAALLKMGRRIVPTLTPEDMLQPNDYPALENNPHFRYEEGILAGFQTIQTALRALQTDLEHSQN